MKRPLLLTFLTTCAVIAFVVAVAPVFGAPAGQEARPIIAQPGEGAVVRDVIQIIGTATHPQFQRYELYYAPYPVPSDQSWIFIGDAHNNQQPLGLLGTWDSRSVPDGAYALRVRVVKADGNYLDSDPRRVTVANTAPVDTPTPEAPLTPLPELPPTESPVDATAVVEAPTAPAPGSVAVPTIAPTPTEEVTGAAAGSSAGKTSTPTPRSTSGVIPSSSSTSASVEESATSIANQLFSGSKLMDTAKKAATYTVAAFVLVGLFFGIKGILVWLWYKIKP
jgi:hypothetical protein